MADLKVDGVRRKHVVGEACEKRRLHAADPGLAARKRPILQPLPLRRERSRIHFDTVHALLAEADRVFVDVQTDVVIHCTYGKSPLVSWPRIWSTPFRKETPPVGFPCF